MRVLFAAAEGAPFVKTGGLGDVIGSLPIALAAQGVKVGIILPKYENIPQYFQEKMVCRQTIRVPVGWRNQYCVIEKMIWQGIPVYFLDNEYYFKRSGIYGYDDDGERYAFFCRAILEILPHLDFKPDILHCHDWHTGMVSVLLAAFYRSLPYYRRIKTVFTIHNLKYQGNFSAGILGDLLGLDNAYFNGDGVEFYGMVSFMKGGITFSDMVTTVSETYAGEILEPLSGEKMDGVLRQRQGDLYGIINGLDQEEYNPAKDPHIFISYDAGTLTKKGENKAALQRMLGLPVKNVPVLGLVSRLVSQKGLDLVAMGLEEMMALDLQLVILGTGEEKYESLFRRAAGKFPRKMAARLIFDESLARKVYAGADFILMPSMFEPCGLAQLIAMRYGTIPIVRETGGIKDTVKPYDAPTGTGCGFAFVGYNPQEMLETINRAMAVFQNKPDWTKLRKQVMQLDFSWHKSAQKYVELYQQLLLRS